MVTAGSDYVALYVVKMPAIDEKKPIWRENPYI